MNSQRLLFGCLTLACLFVAAAEAAARDDVYRNPYTGTTTVARTGYNPYTGTAAQADNRYNPYTGRDVTKEQVYNPYTGRDTEVRTVNNPYTGRTTASAAYRRR
jgi:hypothetical protein